MDWSFFPVLYFNGYKIHPSYLSAIIEDMWYSEPIGTLSIAVALTGILLTFSYKMLDIFWDIYKDRRRQGRLQIDARARFVTGEDPSLELIIANPGRDSIGVREVGYFEGGLLGSRFVPIPLAVSTMLPRVLSAKEVALIRVAPGNLPRQALFVKDSTGKPWPIPPRELKRACRQLAAESTVGTEHDLQPV